MTTTTSVTSPSTVPQATGTARSATSDSDSAASALSSDFETFLRMLTVQMENQDPLNPIQSSDFAVQLATFSGVEQQVKTNDLLDSLLGQQSVSALSQLATWVGMEGRAPVAAGFDGSTPITYFADPPAGTDQATLIVRNDAGVAVSSVAIPVSTDPQSWSGTDQSGAYLPVGNYSLFVEYRAAGDVIATNQAEVYAPVTEAKLSDGTPVVVFASGDELPADQVNAVRAPGP